MRIFNALAAAAVVGSLAAAPALAEEHITVTGEGSVAVAPDMATVQMGVVSEAATAGAAMAANSEQVAALLAQLTQLGIEARDVQTSSVGLNPVYAPRGPDAPQGEAPRIQGFEAQNMLAIRVRDLDRLGAVMDQAIAAGANTVYGLNFGLQDPTPLLDEARRAAVADARRKAELYAAAAGVGLGEVERISEPQAGMRPMADMGTMRMAKAEAVPVATGEMEIAAQITIVWGIAAAQ